MSKKILFIGSCANNKPVWPLLETLKERGYDLAVQTACPYLFEQAAKSNWTKKPIKPSTREEELAANVFWGALSPFIFLAWLARILLYKYSQNVKTIILYGSKKKAVITLAAGVLKVNVVWLEEPFFISAYSGRFRKRFLRAASKYANIAAPNTLTVQKIENLRLAPKNKAIVPPGIKIGCFEHQDNLFSNLAKYDRQVFNHRFFTLITEAELNNEQNLNFLFQAISKCLDTIPQLQLMVIGDGPERKNLIWLSQKKGIDNLVWFVGKQSYLGKWLEDAHIFVAARKTVDSTGLDAVLQGAYGQIPIIGWSGQGLEDFITNGKNGLLLETEDSEELATSIIRLYQDNRLRTDMGKAAKETVINRFSLPGAVDRLETLV